jgi:anti-sigma regulatory factor (Ser/Thr protein kinase)
MVRNELSAALADARVEAIRRYDIALVMTEAAGNAVRHAYTPTQPGLLFVDAAITGRNLLLRVCDVGRGIRRRAENPGLGIGLSLMTRLSDGLEIAPNRTVSGTRVSAVFHEVTPPGALRPRARRRRADTVLLREYVDALQIVGDELATDTTELLAEAQRAIDHADRLRGERHH